MEELRLIKTQHPWQDNPYSDPPLGFLSVASAARKEGFEVTLTDLAHEIDIPESPVFGLTASTLEFPGTVNQAKKLKEKFPESKIIVGGPHFDLFSTGYWEAQKHKLPFDIICKGEGEQTVVPALKHALSNDDKRVIEQPGSSLDLNLMALPARDLLNKEKYFVPGITFMGELDKSGNSSTIMVSRGCPYACGFCASPELFGRTVRFRSLENTTEEIEILQNEFGVSSLRWQDDCIPITLKRIKGLDDYLSESGILSRGSARTDQIKKETLQQMWHAGFREIGFGIESGEQVVLDYIAKGTKVETNAQAIDSAKEAGFRTRAYIMTGMPGETEGSAERTIEFLEKHTPDVITLTSFVPLPGSDVFRNPSKYGVTITTHDWAKYDISLKETPNERWTHRLSTASLDTMETNRELLKEWIFNSNKSNVARYNKQYTAQIPIKSK